MKHIVKRTGPLLLMALLLFTLTSCGSTQKGTAGSEGLAKPMSFGNDSINLLSGGDVSVTGSLDFLLSDSWQHILINRSASGDEDTPALYTFSFYTISGSEEGDVRFTGYISLGNAEEMYDIDVDFDEEDEANGLTPVTSFDTQAYQETILGFIENKDAARTVEMGDFSLNCVSGTSSAGENKTTWLFSAVGEKDGTTLSVSLNANGDTAGTEKAAAAAFAWFDALTVGPENGKAASGDMFAAKTADKKLFGNTIDLSAYDEYTLEMLSDNSTGSFLFSGIPAAREEGQVFTELQLIISAKEELSRSLADKMTADLAEKGLMTGSEEALSGSKTGWKLQSAENEGCTAFTAGAQADDLQLVCCFTAQSLGGDTGKAVEAAKQWLASLYLTE